MSGKLHSLTDVLKKNLFFFESLSVKELTPYVRRKMLREYSLSQVEEKVLLCLSQHACFYVDHNGFWHLDLEGKRENDFFYSLLLKRQQPMSYKEACRLNEGTKKKKSKRIIAEEGALGSDGRFVQWDNGLWGLTEWEVETEHYSLKHLVIKALKLYPAGLSLPQITDLVGSWRRVTEPAVEGVLRKFPFFEQREEGQWFYNFPVQVAYEGLIARYISALNKVRERRFQSKEIWFLKVEQLERQLSELSQAQNEAAAALALRAEENERYDHLLTQMAEKDLLLSLRKKEIFRYREYINKLEAKANSILYQCRLWVKRARNGEAETVRLKELLEKSNSNLESLFVKLQNLKEKEREEKIRLAGLKEQHAVKVAALQNEVVELRQKIERIRGFTTQEEKRLREEIETLSKDLKESLKREEDLQIFLRAAQQDAEEYREELRQCKLRMRHPLVQLVVKLCSFFEKRSKTVHFS